MTSNKEKTRFVKHGSIDKKRPRIHTQPERIGYARVSTDGQDVALQRDSLERAGCTVIYEDSGVSGTKFSRPGLDKALQRLQQGDTLVVWRLDRLGRSLRGLVDLVHNLGQRGVEFHSITEVIDTGSPGGVLVFHMMAALAEFERALISDRTRAGIVAARARGKKIGRKPALTEEEQNSAIKMMETQSATDIARRFNVHPRTISRLRARVFDETGE
ncbi:recombinase family protein [Paraburkholderia heleia]|uniref:recombinase family protein n=1 Tax=Paraburkholderia heleia TaxID=634127 RepID=UPI002AB68DD8|nr:recombinase family protein [Paraburkholderia heleia]